MTNRQCERAIRNLCHEWKLTHHAMTSQQDVSFAEFFQWLTEFHLAIMSWQSSLPTSQIVERWFNQEFRQTWRG